MDSVQDKLNAKHLNETMEHIIDVVRRTSGGEPADEKVIQDLTHIFGLVQTSTSMMAIQLLFEPVRVLARSKTLMAEEKLRRLHAHGRNMADSVAAAEGGDRARVLFGEIIVVPEKPYREALDALAAAEGILNRVQDFIIEATRQAHAKKDIRPMIGRAETLVSTILSEHPDLTED